MIAQENTPESQCGFRSNRGTVGIIFVLRQIQEKCREQTIDLYAAFVDLTKAFHAVSRDELWKILTGLGCSPPPPPSNFSPSSASSMKVSKVREAQWVRQLPHLQRRLAWMCSGPLFSIFFIIMLLEAKEDQPDGIHIRFRTDGTLQPSASPPTHENHRGAHH